MVTGTKIGRSYGPKDGGYSFLD